MIIFGDVLGRVITLLDFPMPLFGYIFSLWEVCLFSLVAGLIAYVLGGFFSD